MTCFSLQSRSPSMMDSVSFFAKTTSLRRSPAWATRALCQPRRHLGRHSAAAVGRGYRVRIWGDDCRALGKQGCKLVERNNGRKLARV